MQLAFGWPHSTANGEGWMRMPEILGVATTRRRLRTELRKLRDATGLHQSDVVKELDWSISKLIRIENGTVGISVTDVRALAGLYQADAGVVEELVTLARVTRERQWWSAYRYVLTPGYREFVGYEAEASRLSEVHPSIIPGLLQTEAYARAIIPATSLAPMAPERVQALVEVRLRRQKFVLQDGAPPEYSAILDEATLRRQVGGPKVMRDQLAHVVAMANEKLVRLAVLPFRIGGHPAVQGAFHIMDFATPGEDSVLFLETASGPPVQREQDQIARYRLAFDAMLGQSLQGPEATEFIRTVADSLD
jgi:transcriptional regulator with XRE-family HTH domain